MLNNNKYNLSCQKILDKEKELRNNCKRAYLYYKEKFKKDYPEIEIIGTNKNAYMYHDYEFENKEYLFHKFKNWNFGHTIGIDEEDYLVVQGIRIHYNKFEECKFHNIKFINCSFSGSIFKSVQFDGVVFEDCIFTVPIMEDGKYDVDDTYYTPTIFDNCLIRGKFVLCSMENVIFSLTHISMTKFEKSKMQNDLFITCSVSSTEIQDCNLSNLKTYKTDLLEIDFTDDKKSILNDNTFFDYKIHSKKPKVNMKVKTDAGWIVGDYNGVLQGKALTLLNVSRLYDNNNLYKLSGEYYYRAKTTEYKSLKGLNKIISLIEKILCGYGERPSFTMITIFISIFVFAGIYMFTGINAAGETIQYTLVGGNKVRILHMANDFWKSIFFSITTFSTVGYGNYVPIGNWSMLFSGIQMIIGVSLCALWTGCLLRKIIR